MNALFAHDHKFNKHNNDYYSHGNLLDSTLKRYTNIWEQLTIVARVINEEIDEQKLSKITNGHLKIYGINSLKGLSKKVHRQMIKSEVEACDAVISRLPSFIGLYAIRCAIKDNKPYLIELAGCAFHSYWHHSWTGKLIAPLMWYMTKKAVRNAKYVLYVTDKFLQRRYPCMGEQICCSNVVLPLVEESVLQKRLQRIMNMNKEKPIVLGTTAAVDVRYKGQEYVIQAMAELSGRNYNLEYWLVGGGDVTHLKQVAEKYGIEDKVKFLGSLPNERVFEYLDNIDIYVQPSKTEGLPRALIEAMSRGCPCVGSDAGGIPELLDIEYIFRKGHAKDLISILASYNKEKLEQQAKRNFQISKSYSKDILDARRSAFLRQFAESRATNG